MSDEEIGRLPIDRQDRADHDINLSRQHRTELSKGKHMRLTSGIRCSTIAALVRAIAGLAVLGCACGSASAQEEDAGATRGAHLGISLNGGIGSYRDDLLVPLGFDGPALSLGAVYGMRAERDLVRAHLKLGAAYLTNRFSHEALSLRFELRPSWVRKVADDDRLGSFWCGLSFPVQINDVYLASWDDAHLYWLSSYGLGLALEWEKEISRGNDVVVRLEAPLVSLVSRPSSYRHNKQDALTEWTFYFTEPQRALHLEGPGAYQAFLLQTFLSREIGASLLNLGLEFEYNHYSEPEPVWGLNSSMVLSYQWRIGG